VLTNVCGTTEYFIDFNFALAKPNNNSRKQIKIIRLRKIDPNRMPKFQIYDEAIKSEAISFHFFNGRR
jgi:hypothetical protein